LITNYASGAVPITDFTTWEEVPSVTFSAAELTMIDMNLDDSISEYEYAVYRGVANRWSRVEDVDNRIYFLTAYNDGWSIDEFYFMNANQDEYIDYDEYVQSITELNVFWNSEDISTGLCPTSVLNIYSTSATWENYLNPSDTEVDFEVFQAAMLLVKQFEMVSTDTIANSGTVV
jgi:hypothetical protein